MGMFVEMINPKQDKILWELLEETIIDVMKKGYSRDQAYVRVPYEFVNELPDKEINKFFDELYQAGIVSSEEFYNIIHRDDKKEIESMKKFLVREYIGEFIQKNEYMLNLIRKNEMKGYQTKAPRRRAPAKKCPVKVDFRKML